MTGTAAAGKSSATKEQTEFVMVAAAEFASMEDADSGVGIASAGDG